MGRKFHISFVEGKKWPEQPMQAAKLALEFGIVVRNHVPLYTHWKEYKDADRNFVKYHMSYLDVSHLFFSKLVSK